MSMTKSTKWFLGILAFLAVVVIAFSLLLLSLLSGTHERTEIVSRGGSQKIAVVNVEGVIISSEEVVRQLKKYRDNGSIKAVVIRVESPGGGVAASQEMYEEVRKTRDAGKPVVVSMGSLAASGGYYVSCGASRIVANPGTLTGSVGVISEFLQLHEALDKLGIGVKTIKSGKLKDAGSATREMTEEDRRYFQTLIDDVHLQFVEVVERERQLDHKDALTLSDGRVFTGRQAVEYGLVDTLGTFEDAVGVAAELAGISGEPTLVTERKRRSFWERYFGDVAEGITELKDEVLNRPVLSYRYVGPY